MSTIDTHGNVDNAKGQFAGRVHQETPGGMVSLDRPEEAAAVGAHADDEPSPIRIDALDSGITRPAFADSSTKTTGPNGRVEYRNAEGVLHRAGGKPAVVRADGYRAYCEDGQFHRAGGKPAVVEADGSREYWENGRLHRAGGEPAIERANGEREWWEHGRLLRS